MASSAIRGVTAALAHSGLRGTFKHATKLNPTLVREQISGSLPSQQRRAFSAENVGTGASGNWWDRYRHPAPAFVFSAGVLIGINIELPDLNPQASDKAPAEPQAKMEKK